MSDRMTYSVDEAARLLGLGRSSMYELVNRGELPVVRVGRRILIPTASLAAFLGTDLPTRH